MGCSSAPPALKRPNVDAGKCAEQAITAGDTSGDGRIDAEEAAKMPTLNTAFKRIDADEDQSLTADEIAKYIDKLITISPAMVSAQIEVVYQNDWLENASVTLEPAPFLADDLSPATGTTDAQGIAFMSHSAEDLPYEGCPPGVRPGLYRLSITSDKVQLAPRYNQETELGVDISKAGPTLNSRTIIIELK